MFCSKCGTRLEEAARSCPLCGEPCRRQSTPPGSFDSGLVWAILTTVCCCQPFGIAAIVLACQASYAAAGNFDAAEKAAKSSKRFSLIACLVFAGLIMLVILSQLLMFFVPFLLLLFAGAASNP